MNDVDILASLLAETGLEPKPSPSLDVHSQALLKEVALNDNDMQKVLKPNPSEQELTDVFVRASSRLEAKMAPLSASTRLSAKAELTPHHEAVVAEALSDPHDARTLRSPNVTEKEVEAVFLRASARLEGKSPMAAGKYKHKKTRPIRRVGPSSQADYPAARQRAPSFDPSLQEDVGDAPSGRASYRVQRAAAPMPSLPSQNQVIGRAIQYAR
jgi:hypothetical protein